MSIMVKDIADYLATKGIGTVTVDLFYGSEPSSPNDCITVYEYGGSPPDLQAELEFPGLQVRARNDSYTSAREKLGAIQTALEQIGNEYDPTLAEGITINGTFYPSIKAVSGVLPLREDESERTILVQNYTVMKGR